MALSRKSPKAAARTGCVLTVSACVEVMLTDPATAIAIGPMGIMVGLMRVTGITADPIADIGQDVQCAGVSGPVDGADETRGLRRLA